MLPSKQTLIYQQDPTAQHILLWNMNAKEYTLLSEFNDLIQCLQHHTAQEDKSCDRIRLAPNQTM